MGTWRPAKERNPAWYPELELGGFLENFGWISCKRKLCHSQCAVESLLQLQWYNRSACLQLSWWFQPNFNVPGDLNQIARSLEYYCRFIFSLITLFSLDHCFVHEYNTQVFFHQKSIHLLFCWISPSKKFLICVLWLFRSIHD